MSAQNAPAFQIRAGRLADLGQLTHIYNHYVVNSAATFDIEPFTVPQRRDWFRHYSKTGPHRLLVAHHEDEILGYATSSAFRSKPAYDPSIEVTVYLLPGAVGGGIGSALYQRLFQAIRGESVHRAYAAIALPNESSVALHRRFGFTEIGTMTEVGWKYERWWDVLWMERPLP